MVEGIKRERVALEDRGVRWKVRKEGQGREEGERKGERKGGLSKLSRWLLLGHHWISFMTMSE
jgi:hypothetical protein